MKSTELFEEIVKRFATLNAEFQLALLEREMLMECCEKTVASDFTGEKQLEVFILASVNAFEVCRSVMGKMANALITTDGDTIELNYRNQTFVISKPQESEK